MFNIEKFNNNLIKYNKNAIIQKNIAKNLIKILLETNKSNEYNNILEIGSGTGFLTQEIFKNLNYKNLILNDIVEDTKIYTQNFSNNFIIGDIEKINIEKDLDLIISASVFQWLNDFETFTEKINNSLNKNGIFAFSMFIENNFKEINEHLNISLNYLKNEKIIKILEKNFEILYQDKKQEVLNFKTGIDILRHIKNTGINVINKEILTKNKINDFIKDNVLNLTYSYNFLIARKK